MMFRKFILMFMLVLLMGVMTGCGNDTAADNRTSNQAAGVEDVLQAGKEAADSSSESSTQQNDASAQNGTEDASSQDGTEEESGQDGADSVPKTETEDTAVLSTTEGIDIDLTSLTSTMVYSEVYNMMYTPEEYIGKTIKMEGLFSVYHDDTTGNNYFACIVEDATACCSQGIEFQLTDDYTYPDDYPEEGERLTVEGVFDTYQEGEYQYCTLRDAKMVFER